MQTEFKESCIHTRFGNARNSKDNFARYRNNRTKIKHNSGRKTENTSRTFKANKLKSKSLLYFDDINANKLLHFLYPIAKHYIKEDLPNMNKYEFIHFILEKINDNYDVWNIKEIEDDFHLFVGFDNDCSSTGHCTELSWVINQKKQWQNIIWDFLSYLESKFNIPILHNQEYYVEIAENRVIEEEDCMDTDEYENYNKILKFYKTKVKSISDKINYKKAPDLDNLKKRIANVKINNYKDQNILNWINEGFRVVTKNIYNYIPEHSLQLSEDDNWAFGPHLYCNFVWSIDEMDPVWDAYDGEIQMYYQEYEIIPFFLEQELTPKNPFFLNKNDKFPYEFCNWLDSTHLIYS